MWRTTLYLVLLSTVVLYLLRTSVNHLYYITILIMKLFIFLDIEA